MCRVPQKECLCRSSGKRKRSGKGLTCSLGGFFLWIKSSDSSAYWREDIPRLSWDALVNNCLEREREKKGIEKERRGREEERRSAGWSLLCD